MLRRAALVLSILIAVAVSHDAMAAPYSSVEAAVPDDPPSAAGSEVNAAADRPSTNSGCAAGVAFTRGVRYDDDEADVLDAATPPVDPSVRHPIVAFLTVRGSGSEKASDLPSSVVSSAMCFAAEHGLVVFNIRFREGNDLPKASKAVAAGLSWIVENADLYGGNVYEIVPVGYGDAGSNLFDALLAGHAGLSYDNIAGLVFVSASLGVREGGDAGPNSTKAYRDSHSNHIGLVEERRFRCQSPEREHEEDFLRRRALPPYGRAREARQRCFGIRSRRLQWSPARTAAATDQPVGCTRSPLTAER